MISGGEVTYILFSEKQSNTTITSLLIASYTDIDVFTSVVLTCIRYKPGLMRMF